MAVERSGQGPFAVVINIEHGDLAALADHEPEGVVIRKLRRRLGARWESYLVVMLDCGALGSRHRKGGDTTRCIFRATLEIIRAGV